MINIKVILFCLVALLAALLVQGQGENLVSSRDSGSRGS